MSDGQDVRRRGWVGATAIVLLALAAALSLLLGAQLVADRNAELEAGAATANAVGPVGDALRKVMSDSASGAIVDAQQVSYDQSASAGVSSATATRARDSGEPVLEESGAGAVVVATYDTPSPPESVALRRAHVTGLRVAPLDLRAALRELSPPNGGIAVSGTERTVVSYPGARPRDSAANVGRLAPDTAPEWTVTVWTTKPPVDTTAWMYALAIVLLGAGTAVWFVRRERRSARSRQDLDRLQEASITTAALATVAQHSLDLADLLPALTTELADALGLEGFSLGTPTADGERQTFAWGSTPADVPAVTRLPHEIPAGATLCLNLVRGGRTVARLRVVAGRRLDSHDVKSLQAASEVLTSALVNAEAFARQRDLVNRMKSVDELKTVFLATASHELRTPVGAISGYAQLLASSWDSLTPEEGRTYAERVDSNARRLSALVDDLLDFSRLERGAGSSSPDAVLDLGETVRQLLDDRPDLVPDHDLVHHTPFGLHVAGSEQAVERVVTNLVGNAEKYSPKGTVIRVLVRENAGRAELVVDDEGPGVPPAERDQIFSRFFRGRGDTVVSTRGVGLGLAIVTEFAGSMGGQVSVTASDSGGARFIVSYPLAVASESHLEGAADVHS